MGIFFKNSFFWVPSKYIVQLLNLFFKNFPLLVFLIKKQCVLKTDFAASKCTETFITHIRRIC